MDDDRQVLNDGCNGDDEGLGKALSIGYKVVYSKCDDWGYGHHSFDEIYELSDGTYIHAECGGCSCEGSGGWDFVGKDVMMQYVPEDKRE